MNASCGACRFGAMAKDAEGKIVFHQKVCKRYPPTLMMIPTQTGVNIQALQPMMEVANWCGEFQPMAGMVDLPGEHALAVEEKPD